MNGTADFTGTIRRNYFPYFTQGKPINLVGLELYDGTNVSNHRAIQDDWGAKSDDLNDPSKEAFTFTAAEDPLLTRNPDAEVFVVIRYSLS